MVRNGVVEAQEATIVPQSEVEQGDRVRASSASERAMSASSRTERSLAWAHSPSLGLGCGHVGQRPHLVKGDLARRRARRRGGGGPRPSRPHGRSARARRRRDPEALGGPRLERGRPLVAKALTALELAQAHDEPGLGPAHLGEVLGQMRRQLLVGLGRHRTDEIGPAQARRSRSSESESESGPSGEERSCPPGRKYVICNRSPRRTIDHRSSIIDHRSGRMERSSAGGITRQFIAS